MDQNGKLAHDGRVCWSEAPTVVVIQKAYGIALLSRRVEVVGCDLCTEVLFSFFLCFSFVRCQVTMLIGLQVRSLRAPYPLIQTIVLQNARHLLQSNNAAIVALDYAVLGLFPVPLGAQVCSC